MPRKGRRYVKRTLRKRHSKRHTKRHTKRHSKRNSKRHSKRISKKTRRKSKSRVRLYGGYGYTVQINTSEDVNKHLVPLYTYRDEIDRQNNGIEVSLSNYTLAGNEEVETEPLTFPLYDINMEETHVTLVSGRREGFPPFTEYDVKWGFTVTIDLSSKIDAYRLSLIHI